MKAGSSRGIITPQSSPQKKTLLGTTEKVASLTPLQLIRALSGMATDQTRIFATPEQQKLGERPPGHQNQHTTAHTLIKATIQSIWNREDLDIDDKILELQKFAKKFKHINIEEGQKVKKLTADIKELSKLIGLQNNEQLKADIAKLIAFKKDLLFHGLEREFIKQHHALPTSAIEVKSKRDDDTGMAENDRMKELLEVIKQNNNDEIAKNLAGLFDANNEPKVAITNLSDANNEPKVAITNLSDANNEPKVAIIKQVEFLLEAITNHLLFCEELLRNNKIIITEDILKNIINKIIENHSDPIEMENKSPIRLYSDAVLTEVKNQLIKHIEESKRDQSQSGADSSGSSPSGADSSGADSSGSSPSGADSSGSSPSGVAVATKGKIKIVGIHRAIANHISGKNTKQVMACLTEIGIVNDNNRVDIEQKINEINEEENLYRNSGLSEAFIKQIKSIKVMELIDATIKDNEYDKSFTKNDINNFITTTQKPDEEQIARQKDEGKRRLAQDNVDRGRIFYRFLLNDQNKTIQELIDEDPSFRDKWNNLLGLMRIKKDKQQQFNLPNNSPKSKKSKSASSNDDILGKKIGEVIEQLLLCIDTTGNGVGVDKIYDKINEVETEINQSVVQASVIKSTMRQMQTKYNDQAGLLIKLTFDNSSNLRKFIHATLLDPKLEFNIDNDPNNTSLNKFLDIIQHNQEHLDGNNKRYLANLLQNHLSNILIQSVQQEKIDLAKLNADLDFFIQKSSLLEIFLGKEKVVEEAISLCTKPEIKNHLEKIKNPSASPIFSPDRARRGVGSANFLVRAPSLPCSPK